MLHSWPGGSPSSWSLQFDLEVDPADGQGERRRPSLLSQDVISSTWSVWIADPAGTPIHRVGLRVADLSAFEERWSESFAALAPDGSFLSRSWSQQVVAEAAKHEHAEVVALSSAQEGEPSAGPFEPALMCLERACIVPMRPSDSSRTLERLTHADLKELSGRLQEQGISAEVIDREVATGRDSHVLFSVDPGAKGTVYDLSADPDDAEYGSISNGLETRRVLLADMGKALRKGKRSAHVCAACDRRDTCFPGKNRGDSGPLPVEEVTRPLALGASAAALVRVGEATWAEIVPHLGAPSIAGSPLAGVGAAPGIDGHELASAPRLTELDERIGLRPRLFLEMRDGNPVALEVLRLKVGLLRQLAERLLEDHSAGRLWGGIDPNRIWLTHAIEGNAPASWGWSIAGRVPEPSLVAPVGKRDRVSFTSSLELLVEDDEIVAPWATDLQEVTEPWAFDLVGVRFELGKLGGDGQAAGKVSWPSGAAPVAPGDLLLIAFDSHQLPISIDALDRDDEGRASVTGDWAHLPAGARQLAQRAFGKEGERPPASARWFRAPSIEGDLAAFGALVLDSVFSARDLVGVGVNHLTRDLATAHREVMKALGSDGKPKDQAILADVAADRQSMQSDPSRATPHALDPFWVFGSNDPVLHEASSAVPATLMLDLARIAADSLSGRLVSGKGSSLDATRSLVQRLGTLEVATDSCLTGYLSILDEVDAAAKKKGGKVASGNGAAVPPFIELLRRVLEPAASPLGKREVRLARVREEVDSLAAEFGKDAMASLIHGLDVVRVTPNSTKEPSDKERVARENLQTKLKDLEAKVHAQKSQAEQLKSRSKEAEQKTEILEAERDAAVSENARLSRELEGEQKERGKLEKDVGNLRGQVQNLKDKLEEGVSGSEGLVDQLKEELEGAREAAKILEAERDVAARELGEAIERAEKAEGQKNTFADRIKKLDAQVKNLKSLGKGAAPTPPSEVSERPVTGTRPVTKGAGVSTIQAEDFKEQVRQLSRIGAHFGVPLAQKAEDVADKIGATKTRELTRDGAVQAIAKVLFSFGGSIITSKELRAGVSAAYVGTNYAPPSGVNLFDRYSTVDVLEAELREQLTLISKLGGVCSKAVQMVVKERLSPFRRKIKDGALDGLFAAVGKRKADETRRAWDERLVAFDEMLEEEVLQRWWQHATNRPDERLVAPAEMTFTMQATVPLAGKDDLVKKQVAAMGKRRESLEVALRKEGKDAGLKVRKNDHALSSVLSAVWHLLHFVDGLSRVFAGDDRELAQWPAAPASTEAPLEMFRQRFGSIEGLMIELKGLRVVIEGLQVRTRQGSVQLLKALAKEFDSDVRQEFAELFRQIERRKQGFQVEYREFNRLLEPLGPKGRHENAWQVRVERGLNALSIATRADA